MIDDEGFLTITGRARDQFKTDKAKFVAPAPIEMKLLSNQDIEQVCVVGTGIPLPIALVVLSKTGKSKPKEAFISGVIATVENINNTAEDYERLAKVVVMHEEWTIENGLMTPTLKIKRGELEKLYLPRYPEWYAKKDTVVWEKDS
jgi:long-chain acyl-CoA synthetase